MTEKLTAMPRTVEQRLVRTPDETREASGKKPPHSVRDFVDLCSSFLADRGCLHTNERHNKPADSAA